MLYILCRPNSYFSAQNKNDDGSTGRRYFLCFFLRFVLMGFIGFAYWGLFFVLAGIMIYIGCFSCQTDSQMGLNWLTMSKDRYLIYFHVDDCFV
jgi:hypothetical protein